MAIDYRAYIEKVDQKIRAGERTAKSKADIEKINRMHVGKNKMESIVRQLSQMDRELAGLSEEEKGLGKEVAAIEKKITLAMATIKKSKTECAKIEKASATIRFKTKTPAEHKKASARLKALEFEWNAFQRGIQHNEKVLVNAREKKKELVSRHNKSVSRLKSASNKKLKLIDNFKKEWNGLKDK